MFQVASNALSHSEPGCMGTQGMERKAENPGGLDTINKNHKWRKTLTYLFMSKVRSMLQTPASSNYYYIVLLVRQQVREIT